MPNLLRRLLLATTILILWTSAASAGMPSVTLADLPASVRSHSQTGLTAMARQRFEVISFFLMGLLACAGVIRWVWNSLRKDFPLVPRLSYPRAIGLVLLWGLLFILVLTMISGARELMTPGAWEKKGLTYKLAPPPPIAAQITARTEALVRLYVPLYEYAKENGWQYPDPEQARTLVPDHLWIVPSPPGGRYRYFGDQPPDGAIGPMSRPLACEPNSAGADRLVLMRSGQVQWMPASALELGPEPKEPR